MLPLSNQQSNTSSTRRSCPFPCLDGIVSSSIKCRCRSETYRRSSIAVEKVWALERCFVSGQFFKFLSRSNNNDLFAVFAHPNGQWCSPEPTSRNGPVSCIFKPVMKTAFFDRFWHPVRFSIVLQETILDRLDLDKPTGDCLVNQRRLRSPAVGVGMLNIRCI